MFSLKIMATAEPFVDLRKVAPYFSGLNYIHEMPGLVPSFAIVTPSMPSPLFVVIGTPNVQTPKKLEARIPLGSFFDPVDTDRTPVLENRVTDRIAFEIGQKYGVDKRVKLYTKDYEIKYALFYAILLEGREDARKLQDAFATLIELGMGKEYRGIIDDYKPRAAQINSEQRGLSELDETPEVKFRKGTDLAQQLRELERVKLRQALALVPEVQRELGITPIDIQVKD